MPDPIEAIKNKLIKRLLALKETTPVLAPWIDLVIAHRSMLGRLAEDAVDRVLDAILHKEQIQWNVYYHEIMKVATPDEFIELIDQLAEGVYIERVKRSQLEEAGLQSLIKMLLGLIPMVLKQDED